MRMWIMWRYIIYVTNGIIKHLIKKQRGTGICEIIDEQK
jgi:hypothetical protein